MESGTTRLMLLTSVAAALSLCVQIVPARAQQADLSVTKTVSAASVVEGPELTYTITLTNLGPDPAPNARIDDIMQSGNTLHAAQISQGSYSFDTSTRRFIANFGQLFPDSSATAILTVVPRVEAAFLRVTAPDSIAGDSPASMAQFGPALTVQGVTGQVAAAVPPQACGPLTNPAEIAGKIALIDRGVCPFFSKVMRAQEAGAVGVIVANSVPGFVTMGLGLEADTVTIPSLLVTLDTGNAIKGVLAGGVTATLAVQPEQTRWNSVTATSDIADPDQANNTSTVNVVLFRDSDRDLTPDTADQCPSHAQKVDPGFCGCDTADTDADGSGAIDCLHTNELAGRADATTVLVNQLKMVNGRIKNIAAKKARINALLLETSTYLNAHAGQITLAGPTVNPALLLRNATAKTKAVFRAGPGTFMTAKSAAVKALKKFRAGLTPI